MSSHKKQTHATRFTREQLRVKMLKAVKAENTTEADDDVLHRYGWEFALDPDALFDAIIRGHTDVVGRLIEAGADVNAKNAYGWTPLMEAIRLGHAEIVDLLLAAEVDVNSKNDQGETALIVAARRGDVQTFLKLAGLGAFAKALDDFGVDEFSDLEETSLLTDEDLMGPKIGMKRIHVRRLRMAVKQAGGEGN